MFLLDLDKHLPALYKQITFFYWQDIYIATAQLKNKNEGLSRTANHEQPI